MQGCRGDDHEMKDEKYMTRKEFDRWLEEKDERFNNGVTLVFSMICAFIIGCLIGVMVMM
jgi:hypothetical protein